MSGREYGGEESKDDTVDLPEAIPPVRPMTLISCVYRYHLEDLLNMVTEMGFRCCDAGDEDERWRRVHSRSRAKVALCKVTYQTLKLVTFGWVQIDSPGLAQASCQPCFDLN